MGTHISKVKSLSLDIWTKEQVESMRDNGNIKSNSLYNPNIRLHPPPLDIESEHAESQLERFIFQKYRDKAFMASSSSSSSSRSTNRSSHDADTRDTYSSSVRRPVSSSVRRESPPSSPDEVSSNLTTMNRERALTAGPNHNSSTKRLDTSSASSVKPTRYAATPIPSMPTLPTTPRASVSQQDGLTPVSAGTWSTSNGNYSNGNSITGRAMTAPLPDSSTTRFASSSQVPPVPSNPFLRQMTASVQIPLSSSTNGSMFGNNNPYQQQQQQYQPFRPSFVPQMSTTGHYGHNLTPQAQMPKGEVWNDLAGLSISGSSMQMQNSMLQAPFSSTGPQQSFQQSSIPSSTQYNPYLTSTSMPYKSPSQTSSFSSGASSFSSLGSGFSSVGISPNTSQNSVYSNTVPSSYQIGQAFQQSPAVNGSTHSQPATGQVFPQQQQQSYMYSQFQPTQPFLQQQPQSFMASQFTPNSYNGYT